MTDLQIRAMTQEEFRVFRQCAIGEYAAEHIRAGDWTSEEAEQRSAQEIDGLLPDGVETAGMVLLVGETSGGVVGLVWVGPAPATRPGWWIYDIEVVPAQRGRGHGRALLEAAEREARRRGAGSIGLNMFGANDAARGLYESSGYEVAATYMRMGYPFESGRYARVDRLAPHVAGAARREHGLRVLSAAAQPRVRPRNPPTTRQRSVPHARGRWPT